MDGQIYFFDDNINNQIPDEGYEDLNINFIHIPAGNYNNDHLLLFQNNFCVNAESEYFAGPAQLPTDRGYDEDGDTIGLNPCPFYRDSGFHIEPDDFEDYNHGGTLALIFDWDQTMVLTNGVVRGNGNTLGDQLANLIQGGDVPATWTTETLARWYLHDPDDMNRIKNLRDFFREAQELHIPVFILTANGLSTSHPEIMPDILRAALNLEIPPDRLIRAGHPGGITKPDAIRDIIFERANTHWDAIAPAAEAAAAEMVAPDAAAAPAADAAAAETVAPEGHRDKRPKKKGGRRKTRRKKRRRRRKTRRRKRRRRTRQKKRRRRRRKSRKRCCF